MADAERDIDKDHRTRNRIKDIDEILASGVTSVTVDGTTTRIDHDSLRKERRSLYAQLPSSENRRPVVSRINLGGF